MEGVRYDVDLVAKKLRDLFEPAQFDRVQALLDDYGYEPYHREKERVQIAVLRLSAGDSGEVSRLMEIARRDYRDVVAAAEAPTVMSLGFGAAPTRLRAAARKDRGDYMRWLYLEAR